MSDLFSVAISAFVPLFSVAISAFSPLYFLIFFFSLNILTLVVAHYKGKSKGYYFILSLLFTPFISLLAVYLLPEDSLRLESRSIRLGQKKKCPACAELIRVEAVKCKHCSTGSI